VTQSQDGTRLERVVRKIDPSYRLLRTRKLAGGVSARAELLEVERPDGRRIKMVFRQHGEADRRRNPRIAADEFRLLRVLRSAGVPVPEPLALDTSGDIFSIPYLVIQFVEGETVDRPSDLIGYLHQMALHLSRIHRVDASRCDVSFLPRAEASIHKSLQHRPASLKDAWSEGRIRTALERVWPWSPANPDVLLHGDYWPGNLLWKGGQLASIIDWEDAALGDPLADVANARLEILWAFGTEAMHRFTAEYRSLMRIDFTYLPHWDLYAALRPLRTISGWGLGPARKRSMQRRHRQFVDQALEQLGLSSDR
jgi:aminoglycoside phosphotransferase (APT) family kinase protein